MKEGPTLEPEKISGQQATLLMISLVLPTAILTVPALTVKHAGQDAWVSVLLATVGGLLISRLVVGLSLRFAGKDLFEYAEEILGRAPGKVVGLLYFWWLIHSSSLIALEFGAFLCAAILPDTPPLVFFVAGTAMAALAVRNGLEVLSRYNQLFLPVVLILLVGVLLLAVKDMELARLLPVLEAGAVDLLKGAAAPLSWLGEIVIFAMIIPSLTDLREAHGVAARATLFTGMFLLASVLAAVAVFGPEATASWIFPTYNTVRVVSIANFLERLDAVIVAVWMFGGFAKIGVFYYAAVRGGARLFGLRDYRPLVAPVGVMIVGLATLCRNVVDLLDFLARVWPPYALTVFELGIPLLLLAVARARNLGGA